MQKFGCIILTAQSRCSALSLQLLSLNFAQMSMQPHACPTSFHMPIRQEGFNTWQLMQDVAILDVRGSVRTKLQSTNAQGCRLEMSEYFADYDTYLEGHIPGEHLSKQELH